MLIEHVERHTKPCAVKYIHGSRSLREPILYRQPASNQKGWWDRKIGRRRIWSGVENEGECFPQGTWIDEETPQTEEALLWVSFSRGGRAEYACWEIDRLLSAIDTLSTLQASLPISSFFSHSTLPCTHGRIVREKWQLEGDKSTLLSMKRSHTSHSHHR